MNAVPTPKNENKMRDEFRAREEVMAPLGRHCCRAKLQDPSPPPPSKDSHTPLLGPLSYLNFLLEKAGRRRHRNVLKWNGSAWLGFHDSLLLSRPPCLSQWQYANVWRTLMACLSFAPRDVCVTF